MGYSKRWRAYNTKHPERVQIAEIPAISNKFQGHTKKVRVRKKSKE